MKVITIASLKGGVGKTALSCTLSTNIKNSIAIDLDAQASLTDYFLRDDQLPETIFKKNIFHYLSDQTDIENVIYPSLYNNVIPSSLNLASIGAIKSGDPSAIIEHKEGITSLEYDTIVIDCPPSPSYEFRLGISCSDLVLVPISKDRWSIQGFSLLLAETEKLKRSKLFNGEIMIIPSIVTEKEGETLREEFTKSGFNVTKHSFIKKTKIKSSLNTGMKLKQDSDEMEMIKNIIGEIL